ncbi:MAG: RNA polymerase sigma factor [Actinomycetes bacterium]
MEVADADLIQRCGKGDAEAWDLLVSRYERLVFSVALRNGLDREDAADVTQNTFLALLDSVDTLRQEDRLASWLMTVARRQAWRARRRAAGSRDAVGLAPSAADSLQEWERLVWLHSGLQRLGRPCRDLLQALYFDPNQPAYADIARRLGRAVGTIGPMRARCLQRLRSILDEEE